MLCVSHGKFSFRQFEKLEKAMRSCRISFCISQIANVPEEEDESANLLIVDILSIRIQFSIYASQAKD